MLEVVSEDIGREGGRFIDVDALRMGAQEAEKSSCSEKDIRFHDAKITIVSARHLEWRGFPADIRHIPLVKNSLGMSGVLNNAYSRRDDATAF